MTHDTYSPIQKLHRYNLTILELRLSPTELIYSMLLLSLVLYSFQVIVKQGPIEGFDAASCDTNQIGGRRDFRPTFLILVGKGRVKKVPDQNI